MDISNQIMIDNVPNTLNSATSTSKIDSAIPEFNIYTNVGMSLLWVMGLIIVLGWLLKRSRFNRSKQRLIHVRDNYSINAKERIIVIEVNHQLLVVGVTQQQMTLLHTINQQDSQAILTQQDTPKIPINDNNFYRLLQSALKRKT